MYLPFATRKVQFTPSPANVHVFNAILATVKPMGGIENEKSIYSDL